MSQRASLKAEENIRMASSRSTTSKNPQTSSFDLLAWFETPPLPLSHASLQIESIRFSMVANSLTNVRIARERRNDKQNVEREK